MSTISPKDDALDHAAAALRRTKVPDGPPQETVSRTLAALNAKTDSRGTLFLRRITMATTLKIAAAVLVAAGGLLYFTFGRTAKATTAFAEVAQKLRNAHTLSYRTTLEAAELKAPLKGRYLFKEPNLMRSDWKTAP